MKTMTVRRAREWRAWCGDKAALDSLNRKLEEACKSLVDSVIPKAQQWVAELERRVAQNQESPTVLEQPRLGVRQLQAIDYGNMISMTALTDTEELDGLSRDVLPLLDWRSTERIRFQLNGSAAGVDYNTREITKIYVPRLQLDLGSSDQSHGARIEISGYSPDWVRSSFTQLSEEIQRGVPWWARYPRSFLSFAVLAFGGVLVYAGVVLALPLAGTPRDLAWAFIWVPVALAVSLAQNNALQRWLFPPFELTPPNGRPSADARLAKLASLFLVTVPVGIIINLITRSSP